MSLYFFFKRHSMILLIGLLLIIIGGFFLTSSFFKNQTEAIDLNPQSRENSVTKSTEQNGQMAALTTVNAAQSTAIPLPEKSEAAQPEIAAAQSAVMQLSNNTSTPSQLSEESEATVPAASVAPAAASGTPLPINQSNVVSSATQVTEVAPASQTAATSLDPAQSASEQRSREAAEALLAAINEEAGIQVDLSAETAAKPVAALNTAAPLNRPQPAKPAAAQTTAVKQTAPKSVVIIHPHEQGKTAALKSTPAKGHYTVQLIGLRSSHEASYFIQMHKLKGARVVPVKANNQVLYAVVSGDFASLASAKKAVSDLPASLKQLHPWIRSASNLQVATVQPAAVRSEKKVVLNTDHQVVKQEDLF